VRHGLRIAVFAAALVAVAIGLRLAPKPALRDLAPSSTAIYAEDRTLLRLTLASDQQYRLWVPLRDVSPALVESVTLYEDRWFYWHPGVNPAALARSAFASASGERRQGGSTITMQLARRAYAIDSRTVTGKLRQMAAALWIEARYSKREILEAYLNLVPYGGNIEGVGAASLVYFQKRAADLTLPEALTLAVIPQNPRARGEGSRSTKARATALPDARERLVHLWLDRHPNDAHERSLAAPPIKTVASLPFRAPHLADQLLAASRRGEAASELWTGVDPRLQATLERAIAQYTDRNQAIGVRNAAAILVDTATMQVKALVGSADFRDSAIEGQVNGVLAKRSPGSTLKPFIYALAMDQGLLHPMTVLKDAPTSFGPFSPENFDGRFVGPITAQDALVRSRNVPAVAIAAKLSRPGLYEWLQNAGISKLAPERHYGLALTLGGGEITMEELARLYAVLANGGELRSLGYDARTTVMPHGPRVISEEASFVTLDMLRTNPRPDTGQPAVPAVAWKTGTSWGFRDAWTAGVFGRYVLVVWVGNFDGSSNPAFIGVQAAAPLFFLVVDSIRSQGLALPEVARLTPAGLTRVEVCRATGDFPNAYCPERASTWFIPGKSPIRQSTLHRRVLIDSQSGEAVCEESATTRWEVREFWAPDMLRLFREAGLPRRDPPRAPECATRTGPDDAPAPTILSPLRGVTYALRLAKPAPLTLSANSAPGTQFWFAGNAFIGETRAGQPLAWAPPAAGHYALRVLDESGRSDSREVQVELAF
jgi:penicillin-binding protein 1C